MTAVLSKSPLKPERSTIRSRAMASTMMQPLAKGALAEWLWWERQGISFA